MPDAPERPGGLIFQKKKMRGGAGGVCVYTTCFMLAANYYTIVPKQNTPFSQIVCGFCNRSGPAANNSGVSHRSRTVSFRINRFESQLSPLRDTLVWNEGIARSDHVSPPSILPEINGQ